MKPINGWTKQGIIDHIRANFKGRATTSGGTCAYRGSDGKKCSVGLFIPDSLYSPTMEGLDAMTLLDNWPSLASVMPLPQEGMRILQKIHDRQFLLVTRASLLPTLITFIEDKVE